MPKRVYDWAEVQRFADEGHGFVECQRRFGFSHTAWIKALRRGEILPGPCPSRDCRRRYDWAAIQAYYDEGHSYRQCAAKFGFSAGSWFKAKERGEVAPRPQGMPIAKLLSSPRRCRQHIKTRLLNAGIFQNCCQECGITHWRDRPLSMHLDHVNGVRTDHRLENLRMLCPNCHSQTETYGGRNAKRLRKLQERL